MKSIILSVLSLTFAITLFSNAFAENSTNPYANMPPGTMPGGVDFQKLAQAQEANAQKKKEKKARRAAISNKIAQEELAKAKSEVGADRIYDPYAIAEMRTNERMKLLRAKWEQEDKAERAPLEDQNRANYERLQKTHDVMEFGGRQMRMLKQMGGEVPAQN